MAVKNSRRRENARPCGVVRAKANLRSMAVEHSKLDWVNLRSAVLTDALFRDCTFGELALDGRLLMAMTDTFAQYFGVRVTG